MRKDSNYSLVFGGNNPLELHKKIYKKYRNFSSFHKSSHKLLILGVISLVTVLLVSFIGLPFVIRRIIEHEVQLKRGSIVWDHWENIPVPIYYKLWFFNITNPDALDKGEKFRVEEKGPYVFEEKRLKTIIEVNEEEDTVTYNETVTYFFRPEHSKGTLQDKFNIPNIPYIALATIAKQYVNKVALLPLKLLEYFGEGIIQEHVTLEELIFGGMEVNSLYGTLVHAVPGEAPTELVGESFALLKGRNGSQTGQWKIQSGRKAGSTLGQIVSFNGNKNLNYWMNADGEPDQYCNKINGSDGSLNAPLVTKDRTLNFFHPLVCRSLYAKYSKDVEVHGIKGMEFQLPKDLFASPAKNPDNECFCRKGNGMLQDNCIDGGYFMSACKYDAPVAITKPHFLDGESKFFQNIEGLKPTEKDHRSSIVIEPNTGFPIKVSAKVQFNIEMKPLPGYSAFDNVPYTMMPLVWAEAAVDLNDDAVSLLHNMMVTPLKLVECAKWAAIVMSVLFVIAGVVVAVRKRIQELREEAANEKKLIALISNVTATP